MSSQEFDVAVIGAGFGGLGAALKLAEDGARVALFENLVYPGGCASTFERQGLKFESGATLFSGFDPGQLFHHWVRKHAMEVEFQPLDPIIEFRAPGFAFDVPRNRQRFVEQWCALPGAPVDGLRRFFRLQERIADTLWELFDDPQLLPPFDARTLMAHALRSPKYLPLVPWVGQPLIKALTKFGLQDFQPLRLFLDGVSQITIQTPAAEAETPFALGAFDYFFRGTGHIKGGVGQLAWGMVDAIEKAGGTPKIADGVRTLTYESGGWTVASRRGTIRADAVISNLLPGVTQQMVRGVTLRDDGTQTRVEDGWGASMLYVGIPSELVETTSAHHLQLVGSAASPLMEGNHVFVSVSGQDEDRGDPQLRTMTMSTHIPMRDFVDLPKPQKAEYIQGVQDRMRQTVTEYRPEWFSNAEVVMPGSPRTFERFTRRKGGFVGGIPRVAGLANYKNIYPRAVAPGLYLVGDSVFPGQSTLATAIGGTRVAVAALNGLRSRPRALHIETESMVATP